MLSPSQAASKHFTGPSLKGFHRPQFAKNEVLFHREDLQGWPRVQVTDLNVTDFGF